MQDEVIYYLCPICGNLLETINASGQTPTCCGRSMRAFEPGGTDGPKEKHVPVVTVHGTIVYVKVGSECHPMTDEHHIEWISILTNKGYQRTHLLPTEKPEALFQIDCDERIIAVYAHCNIHGLWRTTA